MTQSDGAALKIACAMRGEREVLTVEPAGGRGVHFIYGDDASVIVDGFDLVQLRDMINRQIDNAEADALLAARRETQP